MVICEKVTIDGDNWYLVQYEEHEISDKKSCLAYLRDCGHAIAIEPHAVVGPWDEPAVSWGDLSDIIEPRDS
jgi:hypothetical protein